MGTKTGGGWMDYLPKQEYRISLTTMALKRAFHLKYQTIIYDVNGTFYSELSMKTLLEESCLRGGSKMQGRLEAAKHALAIRNKIPLIIDPLNYLYAFPTHSSTNDQNIWVFPLHIDGQQSHSQTKKLTKILLGATMTEHLSLKMNYRGCRLFKCFYVK